jgi:hypothetical protein
MSTSTSQHDTFLTIPRRGGGAASLRIVLTLGVPQPDLSNLDGLLNPEALDAIEAAVEDAEQPYPHTVEHIQHALEHLRAGEFVKAAPALVQGVEGLFWAEAEKRGLIDENRCFTASTDREGQRSNSIRGPISVLNINERVKRFLNEQAFGEAGNTFRHGRRHAVGERQQCLVWLLALCAWLNGYGNWWPH